jgi:hypothetical protein
VQAAPVNDFDDDTFEIELAQVREPGGGSVRAPHRPVSTLIPGDHTVRWSDHLRVRCRGQRRPGQLFCFPVWLARLLEHGVAAVPGGPLSAGRWRVLAHRFLGHVFFKWTDQVCGGVTGWHTAAGKGGQQRHPRDGGTAWRAVGPMCKASSGLHAVSLLPPHRAIVKMALSSAATGLRSLRPVRGATLRCPDGGEGCPVLAAHGGGVSGPPDDVASSVACGREHDPQTVFDNLLGNEGISVGDTFQYCITAYNRAQIVWAEDEDQSPAYESQPACVTFAVEWVCLLPAWAAAGPGLAHPAAVAVLPACRKPKSQAPCA